MHHTSIKGRFCRKCIADTFWEFTPLTLLLGWWGALSFFITPIVLLNNLIMLARSWGMDSSRQMLKRPGLNEADANLIRPMRDQIVERLHAGTDITTLSAEMAQMTGVTPGQAYLYICDIVEASPMPATL